MLSSFVAKSALFVLAAPIVLLGPRAVAQPGLTPEEQKALIYDTARHLNLLTPQGVPEQRIRVASWNNATSELKWLIPLGYPPGTPEYKKAENGGPVQPRPIASINSFNVVYEIALENWNPSQKVFLHLPDQSGTLVVNEAEVSPGGSLATVRFNPQTFQQQHLSIGTRSLSQGYRIEPELSPQLGGFVVPWLLIAILYEPPGAEGVASYHKQSTVGTRYTIGQSSSSGITNMVDHNALLTQSNLGLSLLMKFSSAYFDGKARTDRRTMETPPEPREGEPPPPPPPTLQEVRALEDLKHAFAAYAFLKEAIDFVIGQTNEVTTASQTTSEESTQGVALTVSDRFFTKLHAYPGQGDNFILLQDVLFLYLAFDGKVHLTPICYSQTRQFTPAELSQNLPRALAERYLALDPMLQPYPPHGMPPAERGLGDIPLSGVDVRSAGPKGRFTYWQDYIAEAGGGQEHGIDKTIFGSTVRTAVRTQTVAMEYTGLINSIAGEQDGFVSTSYSSAVMEYGENNEGATITIGASNEPPYYVHVYFDNLFRTFLTVKGKAVGSAVAMSGNVSTDDGARVPGASVTLQARDYRLTVLADAEGNFRIPAGEIPNGVAVLQAGGKALPLNFQGTPLTNLRLRVAGGTRPAATGGTIPTRRR